MKNCLAVLSGRLFCQSEHIHVSGKGNRFYDSLKSHDIIVNVARQFIINVLPLATYATMAIRPCPSPHATSQSKLQSTVMWFCKSHDPVNDKNVPRVFECKDVPLNILVHRSAGWHVALFGLCMDACYWQCMYTLWIMLRIKYGWHVGTHICIHENQTRVPIFSVYNIRPEFPFLEFATEWFDFLPYRQTWIMATLKS